MDLDHERRLTAVEQRNKSNTKRIDDMEKRQDDLEVLTSSVATLAAKQEFIEGDVKEIKADVKSLTEKPGKRWDDIVDKVVWTVLGAIIAFCLAQIGFV